MKIHEYQAVEIFKNSGLPVVDGKVATDAHEAVQIAEEIGYPVVLKAQVLVGGRGKAGGIKLVKDQSELEQKFNELKKLIIKGYPVEKVLIVKAIDIKKEYYCAVTVDVLNDDVVLIASAEGGVEIEEVAKTNPVAIKKCYLQGKRKADPEDLSDFIQSVFDSSDQGEAIKVFQSLISVFFENDCLLAEINPLVLDGKGHIYAADAKINLDDNGLMRHEELLGLRDLKYEDTDELEAKEHGLSFVKLDGNVGCIVNGAGLAMATMDIVKILGGHPANFLDVGGSSSPDKVLNALKLILRNKQLKAILINIFGGITRCDDIANGIVKAKHSLDMNVPLVVRLTGTNEKEAKEIMMKESVTTFDTMREAVVRVIELAK